MRPSSSNEHTLRDPLSPDEERERYWRHRLGRLRLGVEPLEQQLARLRLVTWCLSAVPAGIGGMIVAIFAAFRRPDLGLLLAAILVVPIVVLAWLDLARLERAAAAYEEERKTLERAKERGP
jgi:hypothetical protein